MPRRGKSASPSQMDARYHFRLPGDYLAFTLSCRDYATTSRDFAMDGVFSGVYVPGRSMASACFRAMTSPPFSMSRVADAFSGALRVIFAADYA